ncbi:MAG: UvrD-helicase domain-containing protein [Bacteroidota bacterium]|nr:UvrD-helicase domain-containing protein [Bacteroidota bacterium]
MSQLKVYKASAGSGKTFRLAIEYMKLALTNDTNYRHILAVTFTNKATAEMKSRIIGELFKLAKGNDSVYMDVLTKELGWQPMMVQRQAQLVLKRILHDYSRFSISTIDSFFQRVIKAFNRELGINAAYNVELDENSILEEAVDRLIQSVEDDPKLLEWLDAFASEKIRDGKGWNLKKDMIRLGNEIYNETFKSLNEELYAKLNDRTFLKDYRSKLNKIIAQYENKLKSLGQEALNIMAMENLSVDDFKGKGRGPAAIFQKMKDLKFEPSNTVLAAATEPSAWVTASVKEPQKSHLTAIAESKLMPKMQGALQLKESQSRNYITAQLINSQLYTLGILVDLRKSVKEICREKGVILISDSGHLLKTVIADSETPFVYEKTGSVYSHFMIDEFQDTSGLQWNNFRPLIGNSLSENNLGMVVGDVKQAIYRWRSGDWRLLAGKLGESFPAFGLQNEVLNSNWRSHGKVIRFNNTLFRLIPELLQSHIESELSAANIAENPVEITIPEVYADSVQEISNKEVAELGYVRVKFLESKTDQKADNEELILSELVDSVKLLQDKGVKAREIAILVRAKSEARLIADLFLEQKGLPENAVYNFDILSSESLYIINSEVIGFIISALTSFLNPDDQVVKAEVNYLYYRKIFPQLKEMGKVPELREEVSRSKFQVSSSKVKGAADQNLTLDLFPEKEPPLPEREAVEGRFETKASYQPNIYQQFEEMDDPENELMHFLTGKSFQELIAGKPIPEIIYSICEKFNLFSLTDELAYLQAFVDQISVFERTQASELTSFLNWWKQNGERFTIPVSDSIDAITVLTIHKSKGLEFTHVFVPFFNWSIHPPATPDRAPLLWCKPEVEPFSDMELVPVRYKSDVGNSIFYREFFTEKFNTYIDNLNLMYVVFTRAKAALWVWASFSASKLTSVGDLLKQAVDKQAAMGSCGLTDAESVQFTESYDPEKLLFEIGEITVSEEKKKNGKTVKDVRLSEFEFADFRKFLNIKKRGEDFFTRDDKIQSGINKGKLIHEILSLIETTGDLDKAVKRIESEGKIGADKTEAMKAELMEMLNDQEVKSWFDGTYRVVNERNILTGANGLKRPDRIMIGLDGVVVVDYKSGEMESDKYKSQLRSYIRELKNCGYENVSGFIWYTRHNKRVQA